MKRGEVWWARLPLPAGTRPVLLLSRDEAYSVRESVTVAPVTTRKRGLPVEVLLTSGEGMPKECVINVDSMATIEKALLKGRIGVSVRPSLRRSWLPGDRGGRAARHRSVHRLFVVK